MIKPHREERIQRMLHQIACQYGMEDLFPQIIRLLDEAYDAKEKDPWCSRLDIKNELIKIIKFA